MKRVLIVEDDNDTAALVREQLEFEQFSTTRAASAADALAALEDSEFGLVVLDLGLPDQNGFALCATIRDRGIQTPILVLTGRDQTVDKVRALDTGADDYLTKPFELLELLARVRALLRRSRPAKDDSRILQVGSLRIDTKKHQVTKDGEVIAFTAREFDLLTLLISNAGDVVSRDSILDALWPGVHVTPRTVDVHIAALRKKLENDPKTPSLIVGVRGVGYRLEDQTS
jgi:DNA-binding response OmpR family regulator